MDGFVAAICSRSWTVLWLPPARCASFFISCASRDMLTPPPDAVAIFSGAWGMHGTEHCAMLNNTGAPEGES